MNEPLKCGPCKKCIKRAQDMFHKGLIKETTESSKGTDDVQSKDIEAGSRVAREIKDTEPKPGPSNQDDGKQRMSRQNSPYTPWANGWSTAELQTLQYEDPDIRPILIAKEAGIKRSSGDMVCKSPACRHYWVLWDLLTVHQGLLFKKYLKKDGTGEYQQFLVPRVHRKDIMFQMHDSVISGHLGCKKTKAKTQQ